MNRHLESSADDDMAISGLPEHVWRDLDFTNIHAVVLFADIQNSVMISSTVSIRDYDELINEFQMAMLEVVTSLRQQQMPIGESHIAGDQLSLFFYNPAEVERNYALDGPQPAAGTARAALIQTSRQASQQLVYAALKAAVQLKSHWLVQRFNLERVRSHHAPFELSIGVHYGRVYLRDRPGGHRSIEGYAVNLAKRVETASRSGRYSYIMFSEDACEALCRSVVAHSQLRQRVFFFRHELDLIELKGVAKQQPVYELKFCHRIKVPVPEASIAQHEALFAIDPTNLWSYYQLVEHWAYDEGDWDKAYQLASRAQLIHPRDEKIKLDFAKYHFQHGDMEMSLVYCRQALALNPEFDLAYEQLTLIAEQMGDAAQMVAYMRQCLSLSPGSPGNNMNLGLALMHNGEHAEAMHHIVTALRLYPEYAQQRELQEALHGLTGQVELPPELALIVTAPEQHGQDAMSFTNTVG
jgi:class 3 adenylate cyclase